MPLQATLCQKSTCLVQNPDIPLAGRVGAHGGVAGRGQAGLYANKIVYLETILSLIRQNIEETSSQMFTKKHEQTKSYANRWRNKALS